MSTMVSLDATGLKEIDRLRNLQVNYRVYVCVCVCASFPQKKRRLYANVRGECTAHKD